MKDVALYYFGGSGGFFALWHLILGTDYQCNFSTYGTSESIEEKYNTIKGADWPKKLVDATQDNVDTEFWDKVKFLQEMHILKDTKYLSEIYNANWNIKQKELWKSSEVVPDNNLTAKLYNKKLYMYCNPDDYEVCPWDKHKDCFRVVLYTDIDTQLLLSKNKRAWVYRERPDREDPLIRKVAAESVNFKGDSVHYKIDTLKNGNLYVKLQDIVKTQGGAILEPLGFSVTDKNRQHNEFWLSLHNEEEKSSLLG